MMGMRDSLIRDTLLSYEQIGYPTNDKSFYNNTSHSVSRALLLTTSTSNTSTHPFDIAHYTTSGSIATGTSL